MKLTHLTAALAASAALSAQITYVDADTNTNTTRADGTSYTPQLSTSGTDNEWALRPFANGGTILSTHDVASSTEDAPMLRTTITGLVPGLPHMIYTYWWGGANVAWRGRCLVDTVQPAPELPGYNSVHFTGSVFAPMTPLAFDAPLGVGQTALGLVYDAAGMETTNHFANAVMIQEGNRWLYEVPLGTYVPDGNGEIQVYVDDLAGAQSTSNRTWYDGVGWEWAPFQVGSSCGNPAPQIGYVGQPILARDFTVTLAGAPASSFALLAVGFSATSWNGIPLPLGLAPFGYPGCDLNVAPSAWVFQLTDPNGSAQYTVNLSGLSAMNVYWQWAVLTPAALPTTTGLETKFHL